MTDSLKEWSISARALKRLLTYVITNGSTLGVYKFVLGYNSRFNLFAIYNTKTNNIICTIKRTNGKTFIRYRERSYYAVVMKDFKVEGIDIISVPSENLGRRVNIFNIQIGNALNVDMFRGIMRDVHNQNENIQNISSERVSQSFVDYSTLNRLGRSFVSNPQRGNEAMPSVSQDCGFRGDIEDCQCSECQQERLDRENNTDEEIPLW